MCHGTGYKPRNGSFTAVPASVHGTRRPGGVPGLAGWWGQASTTMINASRGSVIAAIGAQAQVTCTGPATGALTDVPAE
jgi:hypothetical protein